MFRIIQSDQLAQAHHLVINAAQRLDPNWGRYLRYEWDWSECPGPDVFLEHARKWAEEGMQIIGGCCGARPVEIEALSRAFREPLAVG